MAAGGGKRATDNSYEITKLNACIGGCVVDMAVLYSDSILASHGGRTFLFTPKCSAKEISSNVLRGMSATKAQVRSDKAQITFRPTNRRSASLSTGVTVYFRVHRVSEGVARIYVQLEPSRRGREVS